MEKEEAQPDAAPRVGLKRLKKREEVEAEQGPSAKNAKKEFELPIEVVQVFQSLCSPKPNRFGQLVRTDIVRMENGLPVLPEMNPLQQCQQLQQVESMIQYHEQQVKYRSYMQLEVLRNIRKQICDEMMFHPTREAHEKLVEMAKNKQLHPLSPAEKAQIDYFTSMADWTLEARVVLQDKETPFYLLLLGRQIVDWKVRINEIVTHEQFDVFGPYFAERINHFREVVHMLNRRSWMSI